MTQHGIEQELISVLIDNEIEKDYGSMSEFDQQELTGKVLNVWNWIRDHKSMD